ncbi:MAG: hypothetical protein PHC90_14545 [Syntrophorhabdaceae bacterium]|nr:hypothetical protein [Syntrophorhabdaceae bacterium]
METVLPRFAKMFSARIDFKTGGATKEPAMVKRRTPTGSLKKDLS